MADDAEKAFDKVDPIVINSGPSSAPVLEDVGRSVLAEGLKGPIAGAGTIGDLQSAWDWLKGRVGDVLGTNPDRNDPRYQEAERLARQMGLADLTRPLAPKSSEILSQVENTFPQAIPTLEYESKTPYGRHAGSIAGVVTNPVSWTGAGTIPGKLASNVITGEAAQLGEDITGSPSARLPAALLGSTATSRLTGTNVRANAQAANRATAPTEKFIRDEARSDYAYVDAQNLMVPRSVVRQLGADVRDHVVNNYNIRPHLAPHTFDELQRLENPGRTATARSRRIGTRDPDASVNEVVSVYQALSRVRRVAELATDRQAAAEAMKVLDQWLQPVTPVLRSAAGNWRAAERASDLEEAIMRAVDDAKATGRNVGNNLRTRLNRLLWDDNVSMTDAERDRLRTIIHSGGLPQKLSHLGSNHGIWWTIWSLLHGHPLTAAMAALPGAAARRADTLATTRAVLDLQDDILRNAPAGPGRGVPVPPRGSSMLPLSLRALDALGPDQRDDALLP